MKYEVKNKQLLCDGVAIRPEFGNMDHIKAFREAQERMKEGVVEARIENEEFVKYQGSIVWDCPCCGSKNKYTDDDTDEDEADADDYVGVVDVYCKTCGLDFVADYLTDKDGKKLYSKIALRYKNETETDEQLQEDDYQAQG
jgi:hypothetical protein